MSHGNEILDAQRNKIWYLFMRTFSAWSKVVIFKSLFLHFSGEQESEKTITRFALTLDSLPETLKWTFSTCNWTLLALSHRISSNVFTHGNKQFGQRSKHPTDKQYTIHTLFSSLNMSSTYLQWELILFDLIFFAMYCQ